MDWKFVLDKAADLLIHHKCFASSVDVRCAGERIAALEAALAACADQAGDESYAAVCLERDEARKEVERLRGLLDDVVSLLDRSGYQMYATTLAAAAGEGRRSLLVTARESVGLPPARTPEERTGGE